MSKAIYTSAARATMLIHFLWTALIFLGGILVLFDHDHLYALFQIEIMTITILSWFPLGLRCILTASENYFRRKAGTFDGDMRPFMVKQMSKFFGKEFQRKNIATMTAIFFIASYFTSIGVLAGWFK